MRAGPTSKPTHLRPQPGRHRRRRGRPGHGLHRRGGQGQGDAGREPQDGRRLPELRLRAEQGADPDRDAARARCATAPTTASPRPSCDARLRRRDGARRAGWCARSSRTTRSSATPRWASTCRPARARIVDPWHVQITHDDGGDAGADHAQHRHRHRRAALRAAAAGAGRGRLPDQRHAVGPARAAAAAGGAGRRADRLRAGAELRAPGLAGHAGRDGAAHHGARRRGGLGLRAQGACRPMAWRCSPATRRCAARRTATSKFIVVEAGGQEKRIAFDVLLCAVGRAARLTGFGLEELGIPAQRTVRDQRVPADHLPQHPGRRRRGRALPVHAHRGAPGLVRGGQRAVRRLQEVQGRLLGDPLGHLHRPRGGARRPERAGGARSRASPTRSRATASTTSTAPSPTAPRTASSRC